MQTKHCGKLICFYTNRKRCGGPTVAQSNPKQF